MRGRLKSPAGTAREREVPLIGVAGVSLRGLRSPKEGEQNTFCSPSRLFYDSISGHIEGIL